MEEKIDVRYTFVLMLAICDPTGHVIGTDVAIARRLNMGVEQFQQCVEILMRPDKDSNSKEEDGRRVIASAGERGYKLVNYLTYREMKDEEHRRSYMRDYMQNYREKKAKLAPVKKRKQRLTQAEEEAEGEKEPAGGEPSALPKVRKEADGEHAEFIRRWVALYPQYHDGEEYLLQGAKDGSQLSRLLKSKPKPISDWERCFVAAWEHKDLFNCSSSASIAGFVSRFNEIAAEVRAALRAKAKANGHTPPAARPDYETTEWPAWLKANGHEFREYQFAPDFLKSDFHKDRKAAKV